jgi:hypothetical protein
LLAELLLRGFSKQLLFKPFFDILLLVVVDVPISQSFDLQSPSGFGAPQSVIRSHGWEKRVALKSSCKQTLNCWSLRARKQRS